MKKTKDANALRGFAFDKVLYQLDKNFFSKNGLPDLSDASAVSWLKPCINDDIFLLDSRAAIVENFLLTLKKYSKRLERHIKRLLRLKRILESEVPNNDNHLRDEMLTRVAAALYGYQFTALECCKNLSNNLLRLQDELSTTTADLLRDNFGRQLRRCREKLGITSAELGMKIGSTGNAITSYERGEREPNLSTLIILARRLNTSLDTLIFGAD